MRIHTGLGYDVHRFVEDRELWLCGVKLEHTHGLLGHSDADVAIHALCDALLGAAALGDIGHLFPDSDPKYAGIDSKLLLREVVRRIAAEGWTVQNADVTIVAQAPKIAPHIPQMRETLAVILGIPTADVSVKATTTERLGFEGRKEGISAMATALLMQ